jgi:cytoskeleton protein RodZ
MNAEHVPPDSAVHGSPGATIRAARTRAGLSIEELASRTRLTKQTLESMESDAFDQLLEPVYVRGYFRKCARILEIPEQPLIDAYDRLYTPPPKIPPQRLRLASGGDLGSSPRVSSRLPILAPLAAIVIISVLWMVRQASTPTTAPATVQMIEPGSDAGTGEINDPTILDPPLPADPAAPSAPTDTATPPSDPAAVVTAPVDPALAGAAPATTEPVAPAPAAAPVPVGTQLVLEFDAISWARVEDASGKSLLSGVISAGEKQMLDGKPPYSVFLGNAPGVRVTFGGQPVDLKAYVKSNSTARFSIPAAGAN